MLGLLQTPGLVRDNGDQMATDEESISPYYMLTSWYYYMGLRETLEIIVDTDNNVFAFSDVAYILVYNIYEPEDPGLTLEKIYG